MKNSLGNVLEILDLLDKDKWSGIEIQQNYAYLVEKWGEWEIVGAESAGLVIRYVDVGNALFSGLMITYCTITILSLILAFLFGKIILPSIVKYYENCNDEMVDLASLQAATQINELTKSKKEWF